MPYLLGNNKIINRENRKVEGELICIDDEEYYLIRNVDMMPPFFITIVSDSDHWLYLSSNGGITGGRKNPDTSIFPYYTDDKIIDFASVTGHKSILKIQKGQDYYLWEPFSDTHLLIYDIERNMYKSVSGNSILFEEQNFDLGVTFRYFWFTSDRFGLIKKSNLINNSGESVVVDILDGVQNVLPHGVDKSMQTGLSTLVDAYKKTELEPNTGIGIFSLSSIPSDQAKPAESLSSNIVWSKGLPNPSYLLSSRQIENFIHGGEIETEHESKGVKGAYLLRSTVDLLPEEDISWFFALDVAQEIADIKNIINFLNSTEDVPEAIMSDFRSGTKVLRNLVGKSDGIQNTFDELSSRRHFSNTLFNIMRGGTFSNDYLIERRDFNKHLCTYRKQEMPSREELISKLPDSFSYKSLIQIVNEQKDRDLIRITYEYLPLIFSRRHGDPSRPWNNFNIQIKNPDGSLSNNYEGNWRDIFQNWEALAYSYPGFLTGMIARFLNASTADGYNPYRITRDGIDWEVQDPNDPWSYIGYWGDHQIIYLLKLLELYEKFYPGEINNFLNKKVFAFANVPYRIVPYNRIVANPKETIEFDFNLDKDISELVDELGSDGRMLLDESKKVIKASFTEKILISVLTKLYNLVPDAGIWLNTQRPEWNDANNALVGNGVSLVTLYYLRRMLKFLYGIYSQSGIDQFTISSEVKELFGKINKVLGSYSDHNSPVMTDELRRQFIDDMGDSGSSYRDKIYSGFSGNVSLLSKIELLNFIDLTLNYCDYTIRRNKRKDGLYNSYMLLDIGPAEVKVKPLYEMLEGQVAVLSSGILSITEAEELIKSLFASKLYRPDQQSFILYPDEALPVFMKKNNIPESSIRNSRLLTKLIEEKNTSILSMDLEGQYHFNSTLINSDYLNKALNGLPSGFDEMLALEKTELTSVYESVFNHKYFTGRSGSFYKYEGRGSIYWHMVSKLLLAIGENIFSASADDMVTSSLRNITRLYYKVRDGIGVHKSPADYGAFPLDPYSHTPSMLGAQQPGLTGQVKEDIISRLMELGLSVENGKITFNPILLRRSEVFRIGSDGKIFEYSFGNIPINYLPGEKEEICITTSDDKRKYIPGHILDKDISQQIFARTGEVKRIEITLHIQNLIDLN